ncbi:MAG TPA: type II secretion system major pseudopilin GspG [Rhodanobacteraceae bacterium]|nr:type II secretion system major pseudopilin GspG [Rhodanobacteraceae bacterium]
MPNPAFFTRRRPPLAGTGWRRAGFTLIEVLVVVVILAILAAVVVPRIMDRPGQARQARAQQDIQSIQTALNMYRLDTFAYPDTEQGLEALVQRPANLPDGANWKGSYLDRMPLDPWHRPYLYLHPGVHGDVDIYTLGADGKPGGSGEAADIGNWDTQATQPGAP